MKAKEFFINFSGLYSDLPTDIFGPFVIDLTSVDGTNCYCSEEASCAVRKALIEVPSEALHWIDTGDYHYASLFFLEKIRTPYTLFLFDHHPDDQDSAFGTEILSCGNWVAHARQLPNQTADFLIDRFPDEQMLRSQAEIDELWGENTYGCIKEDRPKAYLSIDKDVMSWDHVRTNWDQGDMTLRELKDLIIKISNNYDIIGADVCGGLTESKGACAEDLKINCATDAELRELLLNLMIV